MNFKVGNFTWGAAFILIIFLASSCASKRSNVLFQSEYDKFADTAKTVYVVNANGNADGFYRIKPFDVLGIRNVQDATGANLSLVGTGGTTYSSYPSFRVNDKGVIQLPVIGDFNVLNMTLQEAATALTKLYSEKSLKNPIIEVVSLNNQVTLLGETGRQGTYQLVRDNIGLIELLGMAGGVSNTANIHNVKIIRGNKENPEIIFVNLADINSLNSPKLMLKADDIIYIPPRKLFQTNEEIKAYGGILQPLLLGLNALVIIYSLTK